jgi:hypothetical protein
MGRHNSKYPDHLGYILRALCLVSQRAFYGRMDTAGFADDGSYVKPVDWWNWLTGLFGLVG